eukprot:g6258.t1
MRLICLTPRDLAVASRRLNCCSCDALPTFSYERPFALSHSPKPTLSYYFLPFFAVPICLWQRTLGLGGVSVDGGGRTKDQFRAWVAAVTA